MPSIKHEAFLDLEFSLSKRVSAAWRRAVTDVTRTVVKHVKNKEWHAAYDAVDTLSPETIVRNQMKYAETIGTAALLLGASRLTREPRRSNVYESLPKDVLDWSLNQYLRVAGVGSDGEIKRRLYRLIDLEHQQGTEEIIAFRVEKIDPIAAAFAGIVNLGVNIADDPKYKGMKFAEKFVMEGVRSGDKFMTAAAGLHVSRLNTFGFLQEALTYEITTYRVNEVMDQLTCGVCELMNGRTFEVEAAVEQAMKIMSSDDPEDMKTLAPWPKNTKEGIRELRGMSTAKMQDAGYMMPPFHPRCRGIIDIDVRTEKKMAGGGILSRKLATPKMQAPKQPAIDPHTLVSPLATIPELEAAIEKVKSMGGKNDKKVKAALKTLKEWLAAARLGEGEPE